MSQFQMIKTMMEGYNKKQVAEDIAEMVIFDLAEEGFEAKLVKHKTKKPQTWKIIPVYSLQPKDQERFDKIKEEKVTLYRDSKINEIKEIRNSILKG